MNNFRSVNQKFLCFAIVITLFFHIATLYFIQGIEMSSLNSKHASIENLLVNREGYDSQEDILEERNVQLTEAFVGFAKEKYDLNHKKENIPSNNEEILGAELSKTQIDSLFTEDLEIDAPYLGGDKMELTLQSEDDGSYSDFLVSQLSNQVDQLIQPEDCDKISQNLTKAKEGLLGQVISERIDTYTESPHLNIGIPEGLTLEGNIFQSKSGVLNDLFQDNSEDFGFIPLDLSQNPIDNSYIAFGCKENFFCKKKNSLNFIGNAQVVSSSVNNQALGHIASSEDFEIEVDYTPKNQGNGYFFRVALLPKPGVKFHKIKQNIVFLIDRSHSIAKNRYELSKKAVLQALEELSPSDTFNILIFDHRVAKFSQENVPYTPENIQLVKNFLDNQEHGGLLAFTELYSSLGAIIPKVVAENEVNTAVLLSDGDTYLTPSKQRVAINHWTKENTGKVSLYCLAIGNRDNLSMLEVLSNFNKGSLYIAKNTADIINSTKRLMRDIKNPIGKNIVMTAIPKNENSSVEISLPAMRAPNLYSDKKYVLYGTTNSFDDFYLFFQGKYYNKRININQLVSLSKGCKVNNKEIEKMWSVQNAYSLYEKYLKDGNIVHIEKAKKILDVFNLPVAFY